MNFSTDPIYLDYNATAPLLPEVAQRIKGLLEAVPGNPSSPHRFGQQARSKLESSRHDIAASLGASRHQVYFTSGGTEANNWILRAVAEAPRPVHVISSPIEHPSIMRCLDWLQRQGVTVSLLPVGEDGVARVGCLPEMLRPETKLVSLMAANNETGVLQPVREMVRLLRDQPGGERVLVHCDAVQGFGRVPLSLQEWGVDAISLAAHKLGGPKGIGALVVSPRLIAEGALAPFVLGGKQERGKRAGTESVLLAGGFAEAASWAARNRDSLASALMEIRGRFTRSLAEIPGFFEIGAGSPRVPNTCLVGFEGLNAENMVISLDLQGLALSTGSACSSGALEPSHVLRAMGLPSGQLHGALRISFGWASTIEEANRAAQIIAQEVARLREGASRHAV